MALFIVIWIVCSVVAAMIASSKGGSGGLGFVIGFVLGPLGIIAALCRWRIEKMPHVCGAGEG